MLAKEKNYKQANKRGITMEYKKLTKIELIRELESFKKNYFETLTENERLHTFIDKMTTSIVMILDTTIENLNLSSFNNHEQFGFELAKICFADISKNGSLTLNYEQKKKELYEKL